MSLQSKRLLKGHPGREQWDEGTLEGGSSSWAEGSSASWCTVSVFMVMGLAYQVACGQSSCLCPLLVWLGPFWWRSDSLCQGRISGRLAGHIMGWWLLSPFGPPQIFLLFSVAAPCSLWGSLLTSVVRQLMQGLLPCALTQADSFGQQFPNRFSCAAHFIQRESYDM